MKNRIKRNQTIVLSLFALVVLISSVAMFFFLNSEDIYKGVSIDGINVSGMSKSEALAYLEEKDNVKNKAVMLKHIEGEKKLTTEQLGIKINLKAAVDNAWMMGRKGNLGDRISEIIQLFIKGKNVDSIQKLNTEKLTSILKDIKSKTDKKPEDATINFEKKDLILNNENIGYSLDIKKSLEIINESITKSKNAVIKLAYSELKPTIKSDMLNRINKKLAEFTTKYNNSDNERNNNMMQACKRINGQILLPGQTLSMNAELGPRTLENGFKEAKVIINNELVDGVGGGVCQVVSTLYNVVLLSRLQVVERYPHSIPLAYVGPGRDATISEDDLDFKFLNNKKYPICINAYVSGDSINIAIFGEDDGESTKVKLASEKVKEFEPDFEELFFDDYLARGIEKLERKAVNGYIARVYRLTYDINGKIIKTEKISEDYYKPIRAKLRIGIAG